MLRSPCVVLIAAVIALASSNLYGQDTVEVMAGGATVNLGGTTFAGYPLNTYYHDQKYEALYLETDLAAVGILPGSTLSAVDLRPFEAPGQVILNQRVRIQTSTATTLTGFTQTGWTQVFGPTTVTQAQVVPSTWLAFPFSAPFVYLGGTLHLEWSMDGTSFISGGGVQGVSVAGNRSARAWTDSGFGAFPFANIGATLAASVPRIRLTFLPAASDFISTDPNADWSLASTWSGDLPDLDTGAIIPSGTTVRLPQNTNITIRSLKVEAGGTLEYGPNAALTVLNSIEFEPGATIINGGGQITVSGSADFDIYTGGHVGNMMVTNTAGTVHFRSNWVVANNGTLSTVADSRVKFHGATNNFAAAQISNSGIFEFGITPNGAGIPTTQTIAASATTNLGNIHVIAGSFQTVAPPANDVEFTTDVIIRNGTFAGRGFVQFTGRLRFLGDLDVSFEGNVLFANSIDGRDNKGTQNPNDDEFVGDLTLNMIGTPAFQPRIVFTAGAFDIRARNLTIMAADPLNIPHTITAIGNVELSNSAALTLTTLNVADTQASPGSVTFNNTGSVSISTTLTTQFGPISLAHPAGASVITPLLGTIISPQGSVFHSGAGSVNLSEIGARNLTLTGTGDFTTGTLSLRGGTLSYDKPPLLTSIGTLNLRGGMTELFQPLTVDNLENTQGTTTLAGDITLNHVVSNTSLVAQNSTLVLEPSLSLTFETNAFKAIFDVRGGMVSTVGELNRPLLRAVGNNGARINFGMDTSLFSVNGLVVDGFGIPTPIAGPSVEDYAITFESGSKIVQFKNISLANSRAIVGVVDINTDELPGQFAQIQISGTSARNFDLTDSNANRVNILESTNGGGNLFNSLLEVDPNGILFWENPEPIVIGLAEALPSALVGNFYSVQMTATGGNAPLTWSMGSGPSWLNISPVTGLVSGTPTLSSIGLQQFSITVVDSSFPVSFFTTKIFSLEVESLSVIPLQIITQTLDEAFSQKLYGFTLISIGGNGNQIRWRLDPSTPLPQGLVFLPSGLISGVPTSAARGVHPLLFIVEEFAEGVFTGNQDARSFTLTVSSEFAASAQIESLFRDSSDGGGCSISSGSSSTWHWLLLMLATSVGLVVWRRRRA